MTSAEIRRQFLEFFKARGTRKSPALPWSRRTTPHSSSPTPGWCKFKRVFQGLERRAYTRAVTCQKVRAGGREATTTSSRWAIPRGTIPSSRCSATFRFGTTSRQKPIECAWELVTGKNWLGIQPDRLYITVHHTDDEARRLWTSITGLPDTRTTVSATRTTSGRWGTRVPAARARKSSWTSGSGERERHPHLDDFGLAQRSRAAAGDLESRVHAV